MEVAAVSMAAWLLEHQPVVQSYAWIVTFAVVALWESFQPRRALATAMPARWSRNLGLLGFDILVVRVGVPITGLAAALWAQQRGWGVLNLLALPFWISAVISVAALDLGNYSVHRLMHAVPALWRCHKIHHSDLDVDWSTAVRHHPFEYVIAAAANLGIVVLIGASPAAVVLAATLDFAFSLFNHGNVALPQSVERTLRFLLVTPDMHRVHHSVIRSESDRNFGNVFPWWDRLFATYQSAPAGDHRGMDLGLDEARSPAEVTLAKLLLLPFRSRLVVASA